ncbi:hypothetical protein WOLCODRAFT_156112 [Wolfiporia cocos MD-104 SS10]|uniref:Uncharacterized protein n=1 Tax=Wolfiporia cocos (strain MD-104) TaxID=742152 RepID=A0A2H3J6N8_WOLCO|nr:hypothetical protein WOLCODRAFT_156112 [Wolfiporia cocos MD-104 SS10]
MSDNEMINTANRMIACAVVVLRAASESMEGEGYTQWQAKFREELAEGSSTTQPATRNRGQEDSDKESTEKEGGKDDGFGGDEEEDNQLQAVMSQTQSKSETRPPKHQ